MRTYKTPILINEEPKIFGGKATLKQVGYVVAGAMLGYLVYQALHPLSRDVAMTGAGAIALVFVALAFFRLHKYDMGLDAYLVQWIAFALRPKELPYRRGGDD